MAYTRNLPFIADFGPFISPFDEVTDTQMPIDRSIVNDYAVLEFDHGTCPINEFTDTQMPIDRSLLNQYQNIDRVVPIPYLFVGGLAALLFFFGRR